MSPPAEVVRYGAKPNLQLRSLFHWIGREVARADLSRRARAEAFKNCLLQALEYGLWLTPRGLEHIQLPVSRAEAPASVCFTENRLSESRAHARRFGPLGFGFTRRFVLEHGGHPVMYVNSSTKKARKSGAFGALLALASTPGIDRAQIGVLGQFFKPMFSPRVKRAKADGSGRRRKSREARDQWEQFPRQYGPAPVLQGEAEWRVVDTGQRGIVDPTSKIRTFTGKAPPAGLRVLPFKTGFHLTSIVFPDSDAYMVAVRDERIAAHLAKAEARVNLYVLEELDHL